MKLTLILNIVAGLILLGFSGCSTGGGNHGGSISGGGNAGGNFHGSGSVNTSGH